MNAAAERIPDANRMRTVADFARMRAEGRPVRGAHCLIVTLRAPGEAARVAFVASKRGVGGAVLRNRARRRLREIVRRRWSRLTVDGLWMMFVAYRSTPTVAARELEQDVDRLLTRIGARPADA